MGRQVPFNFPPNHTAKKLFKTMFTSVMIPEVTVPSVVTVPTVVPVQ